MQTAFAVHTSQLPPGAPPPSHDRLQSYSWIHEASVGLAAYARNDTAPIVFIVAQEPRMNGSDGLANERSRWRIRNFGSVEAFLGSPLVLDPCCLVLDTGAPEFDVLELQERVAVDRPGMPIILITGARGRPTTVQAHSACSVQVCAEPLGDIALTEAISHALERGQPAFRRWARVQELRSRYDSLSPRERQVMTLVVCGLLNKQVGGELGISEITVKAHRGSVMRKMGAKSLPSLVTMAAQLGLAGPHDGSM